MSFFLSPIRRLAGDLVGVVTIFSASSPVWLNTWEHRRGMLQYMNRVEYMHAQLSSSFYLVVTGPKLVVIWFDPPTSTIAKSDCLKIKGNF